MGKKTKNKKSLFISLIKSPYYLGRGIYRVIKKTEKKIEKKKIDRKREEMTFRYEEFGVLKTLEGNYEEWFNNLIKSDSKIGIILGSRGSGKSAFGVKLLENIYSKNKKRCYAMGFKTDDMPSWIEVVDSIESIKNNSLILIDEGGILFNSRSSMSKPNKLLGELLLISRHKNLTILFISQNSSNLDVNIIRQADFLVLKKTSLLQKDFERKKIQEIYKEIEKDFRNFESKKGTAHIYAGDFRGFIEAPLPSFWSNKLSKSFE